MKQFFFIFVFCPQVQEGNFLDDCTFAQERIVQKQITFQFHSVSQLHMYLELSILVLIYFTR